MKKIIDINETIEIDGVTTLIAVESTDKERCNRCYFYNYICCDCTIHNEINTNVFDKSLFCYHKHRPNDNKNIIFIEKIESANECEFCKQHVLYTNDFDNSYDNVNNLHSVRIDTENKRLLVTVSQGHGTAYFTANYCFRCGKKY